MRFYTNVSQIKDDILVREYVDGKRIKRKVKYKPTLFTPTDGEQPFKTFKGTPVQSHKFDSISEARDFLRQYDGVQGIDVFGSNKFVYNFIYEEYKGEIQFDMNKIVGANLDIEVGSDKGFPDIQLADKPITAVAVETFGRYFVFGLGDFDSKNLKHIHGEVDPKNIVYKKFDSEQEMLWAFLDFWEKLAPDYMTGWNIEFFDIPYMVNRIIKLIGNAEARRLSPWGILSKRKVEIHGREHEVYTPVGISVLDYLALYKKFVPVQRESYTLEYISQYELKKGKISYAAEGSLYDLYIKDHQKFIEYNILDTNRVGLIEKKKKLIELAVTIAMDAKVNYEDSLGAVLLWDVITTNYLMDQGIVVPQPQRQHGTTIMGAYVKEVQHGMHEWVCSFDLTSLYPMLIQQYNISPETKVGRHAKRYSVEDFIEGRFNGTMDLVSRNVGLAGNCIEYRNDNRGFFPTLVAKQFKLRKMWKDKMLEVEKQKEKNPSDELELAYSKYKIFQESKKIQLNSLYGVFSNIYFRWFDIENAEAVTFSGQMVIRTAEKEVNKYLNKIFQTDHVDYVVASDTDSIYLNLSRLVNKVYPAGADKDKIINMLDKFCKERMQPVLNETFERLAKTTNAFENAMSMKREVIADRAIWTNAKKRYILNVWDKEGVRYNEPEIKMTGIEAVRSDTPSLCRDKIKEALKLIMSGSESDIIRFVKEFREEYHQKSFEEIALPKSVNNLSNYRDTADLWVKGTPMHVKAALTYNHFLEQKGLENQYPQIYDSDKIKYVYLKEQNPTPDRVIGAPRTLPVEFGLHDYIDYDAQFVRSFLDPLRRILDAIGWAYERKVTLDNFMS